MIEQRVRWACNWNIIHRSPIFSKITMKLIFYKSCARFYYKLENSKILLSSSLKLNNIFIHTHTHTHTQRIVPSTNRPKSNPIHSRPGRKQPISNIATTAVPTRSQNPRFPLGSVFNPLAGKTCPPLPSFLPSRKTEQHRRHLVKRKKKSQRVHLFALLRRGGGE